MNYMCECCNSDHFEFVVLYGRRRVGKTTLLEQFRKGKNSIYYCGIQGGRKDNIQGLANEVMRVMHPGLNPGVYSSYEEVFSLLDSENDQRLILMIDEYPYLAEGDSSLPSVLQRLIDQRWKKSRLMIVLCGSSMSFMEDQVLGYKSPLYGRRTSQIRLLPLTYPELKEYQWKYSAHEMAEIYAITCGIPEYLSYIRPELSIKENIVRMYLQPDGRMFEEPLNLMKQEMRAPFQYNSVLAGIAAGNANLNDIATKAGELPASTLFHLKKLIELGIVEKEIPAGFPDNTKKTIYRICDHSFGFWFQFVYPNNTSIIAGNGEYVYRMFVQQHLSEYMSYPFELIARKYLVQYYAEHEEEHPFQKIGTWWGNNPLRKQEEEIDVCAVDKKDVLLGECKWKNEKADTDVLQALVGKGELFGDRKRHIIYLQKTDSLPV